MIRRGSPRLVGALVFATVAGLALAPVATAQSDPEGTDLGTASGFNYRVDPIIVPFAGDSEDTLDCGSSHQLVGGGAEIFATTTFLGNLFSDSDGLWDMEVWHASGGSASNNNQYIVCRTNPQLLVVASGGRSTPPGPGIEKMSVNCGSDYALFGGGGNFPDPEPAQDNWQVRSSYPTKEGWTFEGYHLKDTDPSTISSQILCDDADGASSTVEKKTVKSSASKVTAKVYCKEGHPVTGGGASEPKASKGLLMVTKPIDSKRDKGKTPDDGWAIKYADTHAKKTLKYRAYAVCHSPVPE